MGNYADSPVSLQLANAAPGGATSAPAQRQSSTPGGTQAAPPSSAPSRSAKKSKPAPPKKQRHDWQKVREATDDPSDPYDIGWIDRLDARIQKSIDGPYADDVSEASVQAAIRNDAKLGKLAANRNATLARMRKTARTKRGDTSSAAWMDPMVQGLDAVWDTTRDQREQEIRAEVEAKYHARRPKQTVAMPDGATIRRADGQTAARANLMHDVVDLTGSADKVKQHFRGIAPVEGTGTIGKRDGTKLPNPHAMMLSSDTRERFEAARKAFEKEHPGYTIPVSSVGFGMRDLHQQQTGVGYLGHALGLSFDLHAADNPNLKGPGDEGYGVNSYMLGKLGRDRTKGSAPSRTTISVDEKAVEAMGRRTAGAPATLDQQRADAALQRSLKAQFSEISATSQRFKGDNLLGKEAMEDLREMRQRYFEQKEHEARLVQVERKLTASPGDPALSREMEALSDEIEAAKPVVAKVLQNHFGGFQAEVQEEIDRNPTKQMSATERAKELAILHKVHANFADPARVFGTHHRNKKTGALEADRKVEEASIMQFLEHGFVRDDEYKDPGTAKHPRAVFNGDVVAMLARYGISPGSAFGDTMHFDFIQGYTDLIPGGRSAVNMRKNRASPENRLPEVVDGKQVRSSSLPQTVKPPFAGPHPLAPPTQMLPMLDKK
ncbi:MAG: hypothetical protein ACTHU0_30290 [Kofleriaceae bacterium]